MHEINLPHMSVTVYEINGDAIRSVIDYGSGPQSDLRVGNITFFATAADRTADELTDLGEAFTKLASEARKVAVWCHTVAERKRQDVAREAAQIAAVSNG